MITWTWNTIPLSVANKTARIEATRVDDIALTSHTVVVPKARVETNPERLAVADKLWDKWLEIKGRDEAIAAYIGTLNADGKANLEARE